MASTQRRFDRATGAWVDGETNWYTVSAYRRLAEHAFDSLHKKDRVILTGRLRVRKWDTGERRGTAVEIDVDAIGHDLLWGTTSFTRDAPASGSSGSQTDDAWAPGAASEGAWATPGLEQTAASGIERGRGHSRSGRWRRGLRAAGPGARRSGDAVLRRANEARVVAP